MLRTLLLSICFIGFFTQAFSQATRRFHQTLSLTDASAAIQIVAQGELEVIKWAGNDILIEVTVTSSNGSTAILNHLQKEGRYDLVLKEENGTAQLQNKLGTLQPIKTKGTPMEETVHFTISIPENFGATTASTGQSFSKARK